MAKDLIVLGAGGHCKVILDIIKENKEYNVIGIIDNSAKQELMGIPIIGTDKCLAELFGKPAIHAFVAIGNNRIRQRLIVDLETIGYTLINVISSNSIVSSGAIVESGTAIMPGAIINTAANIGRGCIINTATTIDHDTCIGGFSHIAPGVHIAGSTSVGKECFIGVGTNIIDGIQIGNNVTVGAGSTIIRNIESNCTVVGTPGKVIKRG